MIGRIIEILSVFIIATISALGYFGIGLLMAIESACIPLPSEIIMPFSGYLVFTGRFNLLAVGFAGAFGCVLGSLAAYWAGMYGGRPLAERYGRYLLISGHDLDLARIEPASWIEASKASHATDYALMADAIRQAIVGPNP